MTIASTMDQTALDAAKVAFAIAAGAETSDHVVLRAHEFGDVAIALRGALAASEIPGITFRTVEIPASYSCHGAHADIDPATLGVDDGYLTAVVRVSSEHHIDDLTLIPVLGSIHRDVHRAASEAEVYFARVIYVLDEPAP